METVLWVAVVVVVVNVLVVVALLAHYVKERRSDDDAGLDRMIELADRFDAMQRHRDAKAA